MSKQATRSIEVKRQRLRGFSVRIANLSADRSLALQAAGFGGERPIGCGLLRPACGEAS